MAVDDIWQLTVRGLVTETQHIHTLHFRDNAGTGTGDTLLDKWSGAPMTSYRLLFQTTASPIQLLRAQKVCPKAGAPAPIDRVPTAPNQLGTRVASGGGAMPAYVACVVQEKGTLAGRRYSGRFFIGGLDENDNAINALSAGYITIVQNYCAALATAFITGPPADWSLFAFSSLLAYGDPLHTKRDPDGEGRVADPVTAVASCANAGSAVTALVVNPRPTTMRSRKLGHGL